MKKLVALAAIISLAIFTLFSASGCFNLGEKVAEKVTEEAVEKAIEEGIESDEGAEVDVDISEEEVSIKTDESEMSFGQGADLPEGFPGVVPVYPEMQITASYKGTDDEGEYFSVSGMSPDLGEDINDWYKSQFSGWEIEYESTVSTDEGKMYSIAASNSSYVVSVSIVESEDETAVIINVTNA